MQELFASFVWAMIAGVMLVFAVLVLLFVRLFQPITILSALPLSIGGAVLALVVTHSPFSLSTVLGILMLMGIVAKNSILLVDFAIEEMRSGKDRLTALLEAGHKRARPIVMTSVAMIAGMLPVALVASASFQAQMAIDDLERWVSRKIGHRWINGTSVAAASASGATAAAPEPVPVVSAAGAASPAVQPAIGHPRDLPGGPLPDAAR
jgi:hypothetical protein